MNYIDVIIHVIVPLAVSAITGWLTAKLSYGKEIAKGIYGERKQLYIELFELIEGLQRRPYIMFDAKRFINPFRTLKAKSNLYASEKVLEIIIPFYNSVIKSWEHYNELYDPIASDIEIQNRYDEALLEDNSISKGQIESEFLGKKIYTLRCI